MKTMFFTKVAPFVSAQVTGPPSDLRDAVAAFAPGAAAATLASPATHEASVNLIDELTPGGASAKRQRSLLQ